MDDIRGQLWGFNYPSGHMGLAIFQDVNMNAYKEHRTKTKQNKTKQETGQKRADRTGCNHINVQ